MSKSSVVSQGVQDGFVYLAITSTKFLRMARNSVLAEWFSSQVTEDIINICYQYYDQFKEAPGAIENGGQFHNELVRFLADKDIDKKRLYIDYLTRLQSISSPNEPYIISRINEFIQAREFEESAIKFVELTKEGKFDDAKCLMQKALRVGINKQSVGLKYFECKTPTYYADQATNEWLIPTGFSTIDKKLIRGVRRTDFVCVLGGYKGKKSWSCIHFIKEALMQGRRTLHITHELSMEDTEMRYDMAIGGLTSFQEMNHIEFEDINDDGDVIEVKKLPAQSVFKASHVVQARKRLKRFGGELIIQKYPMGLCTMDEIIRYIDYLETYEGFIPDIIINDYIEKMKLPAGQYRRDAINDAYIQSKGIADDRKLAMVTVSQVTRAALRKRTLGQKDPAEDIRKLGNADLVLGISQTKKQSMANRMQLWVLANRHGQQDFGCVFATNLDIGQLVIKDWPLQLNNEDMENDSSETEDE